MPNVNSEPSSLAKVPTGIQGLDEITQGGLPKGRTTLVCGSAGCGKTFFAVEFIVRGAIQFDEPGVLIAFEETAEELAQNVRSLGFDLQALITQNKLAVDYVRVERSEIEETGEYDLEGLFVRLGYAIGSLGASSPTSGRAARHWSTRTERLRSGQAFARAARLCQERSDCYDRVRPGGRQTAKPRVRLQPPSGQAG
jgi:KaiC